jgi:lipoate-protein ligase A
VATGWRVDTVRDGIAERMAARPLAERSIVVLDVPRPTLVLGSSQPDSAVDRDRARAAGVDVVRRHSGGAAVLVEPGAALWVDVTIPAGDRWWHDDVGRAFHWLGAAWAEVVAATAGACAGGGGVRMYDGPLVKTAWSPQVCFAGLGPGEVTVDGRKVVGLAQRRTREAALFQCCAALRWEPERLLDLLALDDADRARGAVELRDVATGIGPAADLAAALAAALIAAVSAR